MGKELDHIRKDTKSIKGRCKDIAESNIGLNSLSHAELQEWIALTKEFTALSNKLATLGKSKIS